MTFGAPHILPWLWVVVALAWCLWLYRRWQQHTLLRWAAPRFLQRWGVLQPAWKVAVADLALCVGIAFVLLALTRPQWGKTFKERQPQGLDIVIALDVSPSMALPDLAPTRWHQAVFALHNLTQRLSSDRIALVGFDKEAGLQAPLTQDTSALRELTWQTRPGFLRDPGRGMADAIQLAQRRLLRQKQTSYDRVILLVTDGDPNNTDAAVRAARELRKHRIKLLVVGVGGTRAPIGKASRKDALPRSNPILGSMTSPWRIPAWTPVPVRELQQVAKAANGWMWTWQQAGGELNPVRKVIQSLGRAAKQSHQPKRPKERYPFAIGLALLFLTIHRGMRP